MSARAFLLSLAFLFLAACGGGSGGGSAGAPGSATNPSLLTVNQAADDTIKSKADVYYQFTTLETTTTYTITLAQQSGKLSWTLYEDSAYSKKVHACGPGTAEVACTTAAALAANTRYYLVVSEGSYVNQTYNVLITANLIKEGSYSSPVPVTVGSPYVGMALPDTTQDTGPYYADSSYYKFTTGASADVYTISVSGASGDVKWALYTGLNRGGAVLACDTIWGIGDESCVTPTLSPNTSYYLQVMNYSAEGTLFTLSITAGGTPAAPPSSESTLATPVALTIGTPHTGSLAPAGTSYYSFTPNNTALHAVSLQRLPGKLQIDVYYDAAYSNLIESNTSNASFDDSTLLLNSGHFVAGVTYYLAVSDLTGTGGQFIITLLENQLRNPDSEGTRIAPVALTLGVQHNGSVGASDTSYYEFSASEAKPYRVSVTGPAGDVAWSTYVDGWQTAKDSCNANGVGGDEICITQTYDAGHTYHLAISNATAAKDAYGVLVEIVNGQGEGTLNTPITLSLTTLHGGSVAANGISYYQFTTGADPAAHVISATNIVSDVYWNLYDPAIGTATPLAFSSSYNNNADEIYSSGLLQANHTYLLEVWQNSNTIDSFNILVDGGVPLTALTLDTPLAVTPVTGQVKDYYSFTTDGSNTTYTITMTDITVGDTAWYLYSAVAGVDDPGLAVNGCNSFPSFSANESCEITGLTFNTTYFLRVVNPAVSNYTMAINTGSFNQGSAGSPIDLGTLPVTNYNGKVGNSGTGGSSGVSYYQFTATGGNPATFTYSTTTGVYFRLYSDSSFTNQKYYWYAAAGSGSFDTGVAHPDGFTPAYTLSAGTYYVRVEESDGAAGTFTLDITSP